MIRYNAELGCKRWWRSMYSISGSKRPPPKRGWQATEYKNVHVENAVSG
jgi:hypothetical protein